MRFTTQLQESLLCWVRASSHRTGTWSRIHHQRTCELWLWKAVSRKLLTNQSLFLDKYFLSSFRRLLRFWTFAWNRCCRGSGVGWDILGTWLIRIPIGVVWLSYWLLLDGSLRSFCLRIFPYYRNSWAPTTTPTSPHSQPSRLHSTHKLPNKKHVHSCFPTRSLSIRNRVLDLLLRFPPDRSKSTLVIRALRNQLSRSRPIFRISFFGVFQIRNWLW